MRSALIISFVLLPMWLFGQCQILPLDEHFEKFREDFPGTRRVNEWYSVMVDTVCLLQVNQEVNGTKHKFYFTRDGERFGVISEQHIANFPSAEYWLTGIENQRLRLYSVVNADLPYSVYVLATEQKIILVAPDGLLVNAKEMPYQIIALCSILPWK